MLLIFHFYYKINSNKKMKKFLNAIDIFGEAVKIYLNNQSKIKSAICGILTILMICIITNFCWFMGRDIYYKNTFFIRTKSLFY